MLVVWSMSKILKIKRVRSRSMFQERSWKLQLHVAGNESEPQRIGDIHQDLRKPVNRVIGISGSFFSIHKLDKLPWIQPTWHMLTCWFYSIRFCYNKFKIKNLFKKETCRKTEFFNTKMIVTLIILFVQSEKSIMGISGSELNREIGLNLVPG